MRLRTCSSKVFAYAPLSVADRRVESSARGEPPVAPLRSPFGRPFNIINQCFVRQRVNYTTADLSTASLPDIFLNPELRKTQWPAVPHCEWQFLMMPVQPIPRHA